MRSFAATPPTYITVGAGAMGSIIGSPALSNPATTTPGWLLDATSAESVGGLVELPSSWGAYTVELVWLNGSASTGNVVWQYAHRTLADGGTAATATQETAVTVAAPTAANGVKKTTLATALAVTERIVGFRIDREAADAGDTLANDATILAVRFTKAG